MKKIGENNLKRYFISSLLILFVFSMMTTSASANIPSAVTDLHNTTYAQTYINWSWTNPSQGYFDHINISIDGGSYINVYSNQSYNLTGLSPNTEHTIHVLVVDIHGDLSSVASNAARTAPIPVSPVLRVHNLNTLENFATIQLAINDIDTSNGDTITVDSGTYYENVNVYKRLNLTGIDTGDGIPIINSAEDGNSVTLNADGIVIEGFTILSTCESYQWCGMGIFADSSNNIIRNNIVNSKRGHGIQLYTSSNNIVEDNTANSNYESGITLSESHLNTIDNNDVIGNNNSIHGSGISLEKSDNNIVRNNRANYSYEAGINLNESSFNTMENNIANYGNELGIGLYSNSHDNTFTDNIASHNGVNGINLYYYSYNNDFIHNTVIYNGANGIHANYYSDGNTYRDNVVSNNLHGIHLLQSNDNTLTNNVLTLNSLNGIILNSSFNNMLDHNTANDNSKDGIHITDGSSGNTVSDNIANNNNHTGINIVQSSTGNIIERNTANSNTCGISTCHSGTNTIRRNTIDNNNAGIFTLNSNGNTVTDNTADSNIGPIKTSGVIASAQTGIYVLKSSDGTLDNNTVSNNRIGIMLSLSNNSQIKNNTDLSNSERGIYVSNTNGNTIYNNNFNNTQNILLAGSYNNNIWNVAKVLGINIIGGQYLGGNYWGELDGTGFSDTCDNGNGDGICDSGYRLNGEWDNLPLTNRVTIPPYSPTIYSGNQTSPIGIATNYLIS